MSGMEEPFWSVEEKNVRKIEFGIYLSNKNQSRVEYARELMKKGREIGKYSEKELVKKICAHYGGWILDVQ